MSVTGVENTYTNQLIKSAATEETESQETVQSSDFLTLMKGYLSPDAENNVSEEALFAALVQERVGSLKGDDVLAAYKEFFAQRKAQMTDAASGCAPMEDAARMALADLRDAGTITSAEADQIHSEAFAAAQLDGNINALYDGYGSANDATRAVLNMDQAMETAKAKLALFADGTETAVSRPLAEAFSSTGAALCNPWDTLLAAGVTVSSAASGATGVPTSLVTPTGTTVDGADGFLYKPVSSNNGKLAVLVPASFSLQTESCVLKDENGNVLEEGYFWAPGFAAEGPVEEARKKFSFKKPGDSYPDNLTVEIRLTDGRVVQYKIPDSSRRYD